MRDAAAALSPSPPHTNHSSERLCSRIGLLRLVPARSLAVALAAEARQAQMHVLKLAEQNAALHATLHAKHTGSHGGDASEPAEGSEGGAEFFHAVSMMQLDYEERIAVLVDEMAALQTASLGGREAAGGAVAPAALPPSGSAGDGWTRDRVLERKEQQVEALQRQLAGAQMVTNTPRPSAMKKSRIVILAMVWHGATEKGP